MGKFIALWGIVFILVACNVATRGVHTDAPTPTLSTDLSATATSSPEPTLTPAPGRVFLLAPSGSDPGLSAEIKPVLEELSAQAGFVLEQGSDFPQAGTGEPVRIVVAIPPDPGLQNLAAANPGTQFLAVMIPGLQPGGNLSVLGGSGGRPDRQGFLAGYLAAVVTEDWRVGVIGPSDTPAGQAARQGFLNGTVFFCGLCRPAYPPFLQYPLFAELASGADLAGQQAAADVLIANKVNTVYVVPGAGDGTLLDYLAQAGVDLIGGVAPPAGLGDHWVASIRADLAGALRGVWPAIVQAQGGQDLEIPISLSDVNDSLLSPGRRSLVEKMLADMLAGFIDTGVDPLTGAPK